MAEPPASVADIQALNADTLSLMRQGRFPEARLSGERTLGLAEELLGPEHPEVAVALHNLAYACRRQARYDEADDLYRRATEILERAQGPMSVDLAFVLEGRAASNEESGRYDVAEALYRRALSIQDGKPAPDKARASLLNNLALLLWKTGKPDEGERLSLRSIGIFEELLGPGHPLVADCLFDLASHYEANEQYQKAETCYRRAVAIQETCLPGVQVSSERRVVVPSEYLTLAQSLLALARVCERVSKRGEAKQIRARIHHTAKNEPFAGVESVPGHPGWVDAPFDGRDSVPAPHRGRGWRWTDHERDRKMVAVLEMKAPT